MIERNTKTSGSYPIRLVFFFVFAGLFAFDLWLIVTGRTQGFDDALLGAFMSLREDPLTVVFQAITFCGNQVTMVGLCVFVVILPGRMKIGLPVAAMTVVGWFAQSLLKALVARPRPDMEYWLVSESSYSFPSGHANASMIFWAALAILVGRALILRENTLAASLLRIVFLVLAVLIGLSRLYLGVHYPSDVFGGWMLAGLILVASLAFYDNHWPAKWRVAKG